MQVTLLLFLSLLASGFCSIDCSFCSLAVNAIEGFVAEGKTEKEIFEFLKAECHNAGWVGIACDGIISLLPQVIDFLEKGVPPSKICTSELHMCTVYPPPLPETIPVTNTHIINLDLPPSQRWAQIMNIPQYKKVINDIWTEIKSVVDSGLLNDLVNLGDVVADIFPEPIRTEMLSSAPILGLPVGVLALFNLGYELTDGCTSIIAQTKSGKILHARNLDFGFGMGFTEELRNLTVAIDFQVGGKSLYQTVTFVGYFGMLTGVHSGGFSVSINTRFWQNSTLDMIYEVIEALEVGGSSMPSHLLRSTLENQYNWADAVSALSKTPLISPVYYTIAGVNPGEGVILTRDQNSVRDANRLGPAWFVLETNYDRWKAVPWWDDRRTPAIKAMNALTQQELSLHNLFGVLSLKPVLNRKTTFTLLMDPANNTLTGFVRNCNDPCPM